MFYIPLFDEKMHFTVRKSFGEDLSVRKVIDEAFKRLKPTFLEEGKWMDINKKCVEHYLTYHAPESSITT